MTAPDHRPTFHLTARRGWLNDPNGPIRVNGEYHLFAQHNPAGPVHENVHWAHWVSPDLVRWRERPVALAPTAGSADADGCWSGSAIEHDGQLVLVYSGNRAGQRFQSVLVARPTPDGATWVADPEPVVVAPPSELGLALMRDPFLWRDGGEVKMMLGSGRSDGTPVALLFASGNLRTWDYRGLVCDGGSPGLLGLDLGEGWECPHLLRAGDRGVLLVSSWSPPSHLDGVRWLRGRLSGDRLEPSEAGRADHGPDFYAADLLVEGEEAVMWAWAAEARGQAAVDAVGWAGMLTAPRRMSIGAGGRPVFEPIRALSGLRRPVVLDATFDLAAGQTHVLSDDAGVALDLEIRFGGTAEGASVYVLADPSGGERTEIGWDSRTREIYLDRTDSSAADDPRGGRFAMAAEPNEAGEVEVRVLVDHSIVEVFCGGKSLTARVYPVGNASTALLASPAGGPARVSVACWPMGPAIVS